MGNSGGKNEEPNDFEEEEEPRSRMLSAAEHSEAVDKILCHKINAKIVEALKRKKELLEKQGKLNMKFDRIMLKFQSIHQVITHIKQVFSQFDSNHDQCLDENEFLQASQEMQVSLSKEELDELFEVSDLNHGHSLRMKEFMVVLCISNVLHCLPQLEETSPEQQKAEENDSRRSSLLVEFADQIRTALDLIVIAYLLFDLPVHGYIDRNEVGQVFETESSKQSHASHGFFTEERWNELDVDNSGLISFEEFVYCFSNWVGVDEDEEEEDA